VQRECHPKSSEEMQEGPLVKMLERQRVQKAAAEAAVEAAVCHSVCRLYVFVRTCICDSIYIFNFVLCVRTTVLQQGRYIAHKFESGWELGVIKAFDKKGPRAGKFSVKYKDDPNWWTQSLLRESYGKVDTMAGRKEMF
jgi:hypothetical protein